jgi:ATP-dependent exoDNAse (exonuclease V) alpha subunit
MRGAKQNKFAKLHSHGVSTSRALRIFKTYGEPTIAKMRENPYKLAKDINGVGFPSADHIAQKVGNSRDSINRPRAGVDHVLYSSILRHTQHLISKRTSRTKRRPPVDKEESAMAPYF